MNSIKPLDYIELNFSDNPNKPPATTIKVINKTTGETIREIPPSTKASYVDVKA